MLEIPLHRHSCGPLMFIDGSVQAEELIASHPEAYPQKERSYAVAWRHWLSGRLMEALEEFEGIVAEDHRDLMAMKRAQLLAFSQGAHCLLWDLYHLDTSLTLIESVYTLTHGTVCCFHAPYILRFL